MALPVKKVPDPCYNPLEFIMLLPTDNTVPRCFPAGETYRVGDVIDHDGRLSASVVHWSQAVVALLTRRVPDLKLHSGVVQTDGLSEEGS